MTDLAARVAVAEQRLETLEEEQQHTRRRLHDLESDRATVRALASEARRSLRSLEALARRVAETAAARAVELALEARDEARDRTRSYRLKLIGAGAAVGSATAAVVAILLHL